MKNNVILIGYMGCGKSTVGKKLAEMCRFSFLDTDEWIEKKEEITISEIFAAKGEAYFRDLETECLKELLKESDHEGSDGTSEFRSEVQGADENNKKLVISVGGGLPVREENRVLLRQLGTVIYLKAEPDTIYERLKGDTTRPLLQTENPLQRIKDMMAVREEKYMTAAHRIILVDGKSIPEIVNEIMDVSN